MSKTGHVKSCLNIGGPPSKPKYYSMTDSAQVPWGKGEKNPEEGSEKNLKRGAYKQSEQKNKICDGVPFVSWVSDLIYTASLNR